MPRSEKDGCTMWFVVGFLNEFQFQVKSPVTSEHLPQVPVPVPVPHFRLFFFCLRLMMRHISFSSSTHHSQVVTCQLSLELFHFAEVLVVCRSRL